MIFEFCLRNSSKLSYKALLPIHITNTESPAKTLQPNRMAVGQKRKRTVEVKSSGDSDLPTPLNENGSDSRSSNNDNPAPRRPAKVPRASLDASRDLLAAGPVPGLDEMGPQLRRIADSGRTAFEKRVLALLCQIPAGRVSTYGLMAAHLGSAPRAVGNAVSTTPLPPPLSPRAPRCLPEKEKEEE